MTTWEELYETCSKCEKCELHKTRTNCVFGTGSQSSDVLFVGEAPGEKEECGRGYGKKKKESQPGTGDGGTGGDWLC